MLQCDILQLQLRPLEALDRLRFIKARDFLQLQLMLLGVQLTCSLVQAAFPPHQRVHWQKEIG